MCNFLKKETHARFCHSIRPCYLHLGQKRLLHPQTERSDTSHKALLLVTRFHSL